PCRCFYRFGCRSRFSDAGALGLLPLELGLPCREVVACRNECAVVCDLCLQADAFGRDLLGPLTQPRDATFEFAEPAPHGGLLGLAGRDLPGQLAELGLARIDDALGIGGCRYGRRNPLGFRYRCGGERFVFLAEACIPCPGILRESALSR